MDRLMSIYRSSSGKPALEVAYSAAVEQLRVEIEERYVKTRHGETHVILAEPTNRMPVVVFHGGPATNPMTFAWYAGLAEEYRLIAPDTIGQPGYGAETQVNPHGDDFCE